MKKKKYTKEEIDHIIDFIVNEEIDFSLRKEVYYNVFGMNEDINLEKNWDATKKRLEKLKDLTIGGEYADKVKRFFKGYGEYIDKAREENRKEKEPESSKPTETPKPSVSPVKEPTKREKSLTRIEQIRKRAEERKAKSKTSKSEESPKTPEKPKETEPKIIGPSSGIVPEKPAIPPGSKPPKAPEPAKPVVPPVVPKPTEPNKPAEPPKAPEVPKAPEPTKAPVTPSGPGDAARQSDIHKDIADLASQDPDTKAATKALSGIKKTPDSASDSFKKLTDVSKSVQQQSDRTTELLKQASEKLSRMAK